MAHELKKDHMNWDPETGAGAVKPWHERPGVDVAVERTHDQILDELGFTVLAGELVNPDEFWICDPTHDENLPGFGQLVEFKASCFTEDNDFKADVLHRLRQYIDYIDDEAQVKRRHKDRIQAYSEWREHSGQALEQGIIEAIWVMRPDWKHPWYDAPSDPRRPKMNIWVEYPQFIWLGVGKNRHFAIGEVGAGEWGGNLDGTNGCKVEGGGTKECFHFKVPIAKLQDPRYIAEQIVKEIESWGY